MTVLVVGNGDIPHLGYCYRHALEELGHSVVFADERQAFGWLDRHRTRSIVWRLRRNRPTGTGRFNRLLLAAAAKTPPRLILSTMGSYIAPETLEQLRRGGAALLNYSTDDPFNPIVSNKYILQSLPLWDVFATPRPGAMAQLEEYCKGRVVYSPFAYDPRLHFREQFASAEEERRFTSDIVFVGTCDRARMPLLEALAGMQNVNLQLYGGGYYGFSKALRARHHGFANGRAYRCVLTGAKIALTLVRHSNRDTHVMRTFEVPACGTLMLAERTDEHRSLFEEDREAVYFSSAEEMLDKTAFYLKHDSEREKIARAGYERVTRGKNTYKDRLETLLTYIK